MIPSAVAISLAAAAAYTFKLPVAVGAHPFWATQVILVGACLGFALTFIPFQRPNLKVVAYIVLTIGCYLIAHYGKTQFAASYADDRFAGQLWYFGWFGIMGFGFASIGVAVKIASQR